jgi:cystathionine gamma-lyase
MYSATKALSGHSDLVLGGVAVRDPEWAEDLRGQRSQGGAIAGPFEAWLLQRSLPTLALRLARQSENALALARMLHERDGVADVRHPGLEDHPGHAIAARQMRLFGPVVSFTLDSAERAQAFLARLELVAEATSFGGVHSSAERRARWGRDDVAEGFIRFSAGCEDADDLLADVQQALARS